AAVLALSATSASAGSKYGTAEQAQDLATQLIDIIDSGGIEAGVAAVHDQSGPFQATNMGVHIFADSVIMADSRDPELETVSYAGVADLNGVDFWEGMVTAANGNQNFETRWYDYDDDTQEYTYNCHSQWQTEGSVMVWICR
ncbi:MAG: hypothetical protein AAGC83_09070, partial [Pseudomonadota bacterium]